MIHSEKRPAARERRECDENLGEISIVRPSKYTKAAHTEGDGGMTSTLDQQLSIPVCRRHGEHEERESIPAKARIEDQKQKNQHLKQVNATTRMFRDFADSSPDS